MIDFLVIKVPSAYNVIIGRPCIRMAKVDLSTYHLVVKFLIEGEIGEVRENWLMARDSYFVTVSVKQKAKETFTISLDNLAE